jgi:Pycsar effector protein
VATRALRDTRRHQGALTPADADVASARAAGSIRRRSRQHVVDYVLRNVHQQLVALSSQADLKANIMITVTSILLSLSLTHLDSGRLRWSAIVFSSFLLIALVFALLSVLPKFPFPGQRKSPQLSDPDLLFFNHAAAMPKDDYLEEMAAVLKDDGSAYKALVSNLHNQSTYLLNAKYRYLTLSYLAFLAGVLAATIAFVAYALR